MWFLLSIASFSLAVFGFIYVFGTITSAEKEPSFFLKWYVEFVATGVLTLFGFSIFAMIKFIIDIVKMFV